MVKGKPVFICHEGDEINLYPDVSARVYETPGHHPSCLTFEVGYYLFTGDAFIPGIKVVTNLPGGNKQLAEVSKERITTMLQGLVLCPGHINQEDNV